jgi:hypothetical protein
MMTWPVLLGGWKMARDSEATLLSPTHYFWPILAGGWWVACCSWAWFSDPLRTVMTFSCAIANTFLVVVKPAESDAVLRVADDHGAGR